jgi:superfamily II DNA or RNA helicase
VTAIKLRDYQRETLDAVFQAWGEGMRRPAVVLPTGAGKTVVFATLIKEFRERHYAAGVQHTGSRVIVLAHRDELVDQAIAKIRAIAPELRVGKIKADDNAYGVDVMVCSVQW